MEKTSTILYNKGNHSKELLRFFSSYIGQYVRMSNSQRRYVIKGIKDEALMVSDTLMKKKTQTHAPESCLIILKSVEDMTPSDSAECTKILGLDETYQTYVKTIITQYNRGNDFFGLLTGHGITIQNIVALIDFIRAQGYYLPYGGIDFTMIVVGENSIITETALNLSSIQARKNKITNTWRPLVGYSRYDISRNGDIWDNLKGNKISEFIMPNTKLIFCSIEKNGRYHEHQKKRLVMNTFAEISRRDDTNHIINIDGDYENNTYKNLKWIENEDGDSSLEKLTRISHLQHLTKTDVLNIRDFYFYFDVSLEDISEQFKITIPFLTQIIDRKTLNTI